MLMLMLIIGYADTCLKEGKGEYVGRTSSPVPCLVGHPFPLPFLVQVCVLT